MENQNAAGVLEVSKRREKKPRRSSILKRALVDINNGGEDREKRRVSFKPSIMVKEFQKNNSGELEASGDSAAAKPKPKDTEGSSLSLGENHDDVYMVPANQSYYQISTPVGDKRRRLSAAAVSRLSIIPQLEKSFTSCDETPDFELFEDSSEAAAPKEAITLQEPITAESKKEGEHFLASIKACDFVESTKQENESFNLSCMDHASVAGNALVIKCPSFDASSLNSPSVDHNEVLGKPAEEENTTVFGDSSMELTLEGEQFSDSIMFVDKPLVAQEATHLEPFTSVHISSQHDLLPGNDIQDKGQSCSIPLNPDKPLLEEATEEDYSVKDMSLSNIDNSHVDLHEEDSPECSIDMSGAVVSSQASHQPPVVVVSQSQPFSREPCQTVYGDADMSLTSIDGSHIDLRIKPTSQPNEGATARPDTTMFSGTMMLTCVDTPDELKSSAAKTDEAVLSVHEVGEKVPASLQSSTSQSIAEPPSTTAATKTQPLPPVADVLPNTDGQNQACSSEPDVTSDGAISRPVSSTVAVMPQMKPPPIGFKRPRHVLSSSVVSKRMAFGKARAMPKPNTPKLAAGQVQHLQLPGSGMPLLRSPSITASLLKKPMIRSKTPAKLVTAASSHLPPTPQVLSASKLPPSVIPTSATRGSRPPCSPLLQNISRPADITHVIEQRNVSPESPCSFGSSLAPCTTTYTVAPPRREGGDMDNSYKEIMMPNTEGGDDWLTNPDNNNPSLLEFSADMTPAVLSPAPAPVIHTPLVSSLAAAPVVHSPILYYPPTTAAPVVHSPPLPFHPTTAAPVVHSPPLPFHPTTAAPVVHSPPLPFHPTTAAPVVHSPPLSFHSTTAAPVVHNPPSISNPVSSSVVLTTVLSAPQVSSPAVSSVNALVSRLASMKTTQSPLNPDLITTPRLVVVDQLDTTISPLPVPALSMTIDQSGLEPIVTGGMDRTIRVISPTALGKFAAFANADKSINLAAEYEQQLLQEEASPATPQLAREHSTIASDTPKQAQSMVDPTTPLVQSLVDPVTPRVQSLVHPITPQPNVQQDEETMMEDEAQPSEGDKTILPPEEEKLSATVEDDTEENRVLQISAVQPIDGQREDTQIEKKDLRQQQAVEPPSLPDESHREMLATSLPLLPNEQDSQIIINLLDDIHLRFKCLHKATLVRVLLSNYSSGHEGLRGRLEHYYEIIHCCIGMIRCLIDYSRLTDIAETPCSITLPPSLLPDSDQDIRGELVLQARWILALCKTLDPLYKTCHKAMAMLFKRSGWIIHSWKRDEVNVYFGKKGEKLQLKFMLDMNQSEGRYGKIQCQKVTEIVIVDKSKGCSVPKGLKCSSVLDIPVALQMVSLAV